MTKVIRQNLPDAGVDLYVASIPSGHGTDRVIAQDYYIQKIQNIKQLVKYEPRRKITYVLHMRKQRRRSVVR